MCALRYVLNLSRICLLGICVSMYNYVSENLLLEVRLQHIRCRLERRNCHLKHGEVTLNTTHLFIYFFVIHHIVFKYEL
jgi:hypothetical protein